MITRWLLHTVSYALLLYYISYSIYAVYEQHFSPKSAVCKQQKRTILI